MKRLLRKAASLFALIVVAGCVRPPHLDLLQRSERIAPEACAQLINGIREQSNELASLKLLARSDLRWGNERESFRYALVFRAPMDLRFEIFPAGQAFSLALFVQSADGATLIIPSEKEATKTPPDSGALRELIRIPVRESDLPYLVTGRVPERLLASGASPACRMDDSMWYVSSGNFIFAGAREKKIFSKAFLLNEFSEELMGEIELSSGTKTASLPEAAIVTLFSPDAVINLSFERIDPVSAPSDAIFEVRIPASFTIKDRRSH